MLHPKEYYRSYLAGDDLSELNRVLADHILRENPNHVLEFGCGTGKNLRLIQKMQAAYSRSNVAVSGIDVSLINVLNSYVKHNIQHISIGDENYLRHYCNYDVVFTCSVLDHIEDIDGIIQELQRIANKCVIIAECVEADNPNYYYTHDFAKYGFERLDETKFYSDADYHTYYIYRWYKPQNEIPTVNDDLAL